jgi:hypothetical protein
MGGYFVAGSQHAYRRQCSLATEAIAEDHLCNPQVYRLLLIRS